MSPTTRDVTKHAKARKRRYFKAQERLEYDRARRSRPLKPSSKRSMIWGCLKTS